jgi:hypothetical protein
VFQTHPCSNYTCSLLRVNGANNILFAVLNGWAQTRKRLKVRWENSLLIAEIHGKRLPEAEGQEDWLTSAVFGHLRHVAPGAFWADFLDRARTVRTGFSLHSRICADGIRLAGFRHFRLRSIYARGSPLI